jgi:hypothetical protein
MNELIKSIFIIIQLRILEKFPSLSVQLYYDSNLKEYYITLNDIDIFHSDECCRLLFILTQEFLWKNHINNVFFAVESGQKFEEPKLTRSFISNQGYITIPNYEVSNYSKQNINPLLRTAA